MLNSEGRLSGGLKRHSGLGALSAVPPRREPHVEKFRPLCPGTTSRHEARTWVTQEGIDMGNTFRLDLGPLGGHAVENYFVGPRAFALGERAFEGPKDGSGTGAGFGVSRKTAYKWKARFMEGGRRSLRDRPRRPCHSPRRMSALWRKRIKAMRGRHRRWGGKKIRARLRELHPGQRVPAVRTMTRWLGHWNVGKERRRRSPKGPVIQRRKLTIAKRVNAVWTVDFKGWWCTADGSRVEPLTA